MARARRIGRRSALRMLRPLAAVCSDFTFSSGIQSRKVGQISNAGEAQERLGSDEQVVRVVGDQPALEQRVEGHCRWPSRG